MDSFGPLYPDLIPLIIRVQNDAERVTGYKVRVTDGMRPYTLQDARYAIGRTVAGQCIDAAHPLGLPVTNARAGLSFHQYGLAIDFCFVCDDPYLEHCDASKSNYAWNQFGTLVKAYGFKWGGEFRLLVDKPHAELSYGLTIAEALELHSIGGLRGVWTQIDKMRGVDSSSLWPEISGL